MQLGDQILFGLLRCSGGIIHPLTDAGQLGGLIVQIRQPQKVYLRLELVRLQCFTDLHGQSFAFIEKDQRIGLVIGYGALMLALQLKIGAGNAYQLLDVPLKGTHTHMLAYKKLISVCGLTQLRFVIGLVATGGAATGGQIHAINFDGMEKLCCCARWQGAGVARLAAIAAVAIAVSVNAHHGVM